MEKSKIKIVILAAGLGKRMQSELPKVLAKVKGKAMIEHVRTSLSGITEEKPIVVVGHKAELIKEKFGDSFIYVNQTEQLGTGHALLTAKEACADAEHIVMLQGDQPFVSGNSIEKMIEKHISSQAKITFSTIQVQDFEDWRKAFIGFGRIIRKGSQIIGIREYKDASEEEKNIKELNAGPSVFEASWLWPNLEKLENNNIQKEYYLTDLIKSAMNSGVKVATFALDPHEALGANSKEELDILEKFSV